ncbi:RING finger protein 24 isoform X2 [Kogia breviceps]|uniref:RING finger protein 24 isoform X2 n=1 Tax=Kogia breviceps TaxID=27615 RepID=UPI0034D1F811
MSSDFPHYNFRMPNIGFQNLPLNIYIVVFGTAIFVFILSLLFCCYLIRLRHQAHKEFYAYKQVILKEKVKELNLHEMGSRSQKKIIPRLEPLVSHFTQSLFLTFLQKTKMNLKIVLPSLNLNVNKNNWYW